MPVETAVVERLVSRARPTGRLDPADLAAAVPLDTLSVLDLADLIDRLEEAGIEVEIDPRLLVARAPVPHDQIPPPAVLGAPNGGAPTRIGVFPRPDAPPSAARPIGPADAADHGHAHHGAGREISPTLLAIGSMVVAVLLILLATGGGHAGG